MEIKITKQMVEDIISHYKLRIAARTRTMPDPNYRDRFISFADPKDEAEANRYAREIRDKALAFITKAQAIIDHLEDQIATGRLCGACRKDKLCDNCASL